MQSFKAPNINATNRLLSGGTDISLIFASKGDLASANSLMGTAITANSAVGGISVNTTFAANTPLSAIIQRMLVAAIPAVYTYPTISISITPTSYEVGTLINPTIVSTWTQNDAGSITSYKFLSSGDGTSYSLVSTSNSVPNSYTSPSFNILNTVYFKTSASYAQGQIKTDNYGQNSGSAITAGASASNAISISTFRNIFYTSDSSASTILSSSANIRALTGISQALTNSQIITNNVVSGQTRVAIAYPLNYQVSRITLPVTGDIYNTTNNNTITNYFNVSAGVSVTGANGLSPTAYRVFQLKNPASGSGTISFYTNYNSATSNPDTANPSLTILAPTPSYPNLEAGVTQSTSIQTTYTQHGGGSQTSVTILSSSTSNGTYSSISNVNTSATSYTYNFNIIAPSTPSTPTNYYYKAQAPYNAGVQLYTDFNDPYGTPVSSGTASSTSYATITLTSYYRYYLGITTNNTNGTTIVPNGSDIISAYTTSSTVNGISIITNGSGLATAKVPVASVAFNLASNPDRAWFVAIPSYLDTDLIHPLTFTDGAGNQISPSISRNQNITNQYGIPQSYNIYYLTNTTNGNFTYYLS